MTMKFSQAIQLGIKLAEYFVYYSDGVEDYVALTDRLRARVDTERTYTVY
jgi:hypothetical protein